MQASRRSISAVSPNSCLTLDSIHKAQRCLPALVKSEHGGLFQEMELRMRRSQEGSSQVSTLDPAAQMCQHVLFVPFGLPPTYHPGWANWRSAAS